MSNILSQESSKRLHELGVKVENALVWVDYINGPIVVSSIPDMAESVPAPTFEELWAVMPHRIEIGGHQCVPIQGKTSNTTFVAYSIEGSLGDTMSEIFEHESPTEALGLLVIWLAENGHMKGDG